MEAEKTECPNAPECRYIITEEGQRPRWRRWKCTKCGRIWRMTVEDWRLDVPAIAVEEVSEPRITSTT